jgi:hypothetical protein
MGVVKGVAKHKGKKVVNNALDDMGVVGDVIDKHTTTGPLDAADDKLDKATDNIGKKKKDGPFKKK